MKKLLLTAICVTLLAACATAPVAKKHPQAPSLDDILKQLSGPQGDDESNGLNYEMPITPYTDIVFLLETDYAGDWKAHTTWVPSIPGEMPVVCFMIKDQMYIECYYRNIESGDVQMRTIIPKEIQA